MDSIYIRESEHYSKKYLIDLLGQSVHDKLLNQAVITYDAVNDTYQFNYVGVIIIDEMVINCYPKYIHEKSSIHDDFKQVINVIKRYESTCEDDAYEDIETDNLTSNMLPMMLFFVEDYYENGVYTKIHSILEDNGDGEIDWNRTVNKDQSIVINDKAYYTHLQTKRKLNDLYDYYRLLHEYIITDCSNYLEKNELLHLFDLTPVEISDNHLDDFGKLDFILNKLDKQQNIEFNTHKQKLLKVMHSYLSKNNLFNDENTLLLYGTRTYHDVWEKVCKHVLKDKLDKKLSKLHLPCQLNDKYNPSYELIKVIKKPTWILKDKHPRKTDTFIPDIVAIKDDQFIILDAKYYDLTTDKNISGQPGLESITKEYLYELAFKEFTEDNAFKTIKNAFLFPTEKSEVNNLGIVKLDILSLLGLQDIQLIMLPANLVYEHYLDNTKMNISHLKLE
ncbi:MAG: hypothetical protein BZ136_00290 [Methanosphaera sp. rholeuAM74]|nr:MAG: hypothetical protein BZ136_00290 [Methanosphaera sp. rholeuAM74]